MKSKKFFKKFSLIFGFVSCLSIVCGLTFSAINNNQVNNLYSKNASSKLIDNHNSENTYIPSEYNLVGSDDYFFESTNLAKPDGSKYTYSELFASQHFGNNWVGIDLTSNSNQYNTSSAVYKAIKTLVTIATEDIHPTVVSNLDDDTYMRIDNFYIDNFTGSITANVAIRYYWKNGQLIDCTSNNSSNPELTQTITLTGFKSSNETIISNSINVNIINDTEITIDNITDFSNDNQYNNLTNAFSSTILNPINSFQSDMNTKTYDATSGSNPKIVAYPGLKQLKTNIGVTNYFTTKYVDTETFIIYDDPASSGDNYRQTIGTFCFGENNKASTNNQRTFVANYNVPSEKTTTYIQEGRYPVVPGSRNKLASSYDTELEIKNLKNELFVSMNDIIKDSYTEDGTSLSDFEIITTPQDLIDKNYINDITGEITIEVKLSGTYLYKGVKVTNTDPNSGNERIFTLTLYGFEQVQPTKVSSKINVGLISDEIVNNVPSYFIDDSGQRTNDLKKLLELASQVNQNGFSSVPNGFYDNLSFESYYRSKNNQNYLGTPNDINGTLVLKMKATRYYSPTNGLLIDDVNNPLELTTIVENLQKIDIENAAYVKNGEEGINITGYQEFLPKEVLGNVIRDQTTGYTGILTITEIINLVYNYGIGGNKTDNIKNNITFTTVDNKSLSSYKESNQYMSLNDPKTSNLNGTLNLYFSISGLLDQNDGIEVTIPSSYQILINGFKSIVETKLLNEVSLVMTDEKIYSSDVGYASDPNEAFKKILLRRGSNRKPLNIGNLFQDEKGIPINITNNVINNTQSSDEELLNYFNSYFEVSVIPDANGIDGFYYKDGYLDVIIYLKQYFDENGNLKIATSKDEYLAKQIRFTGFEQAAKTLVNGQVNLASVMSNNYASDFANPTSIETIILENKDEFFINMPTIFYEENVINNNNITNNALDVDGNSIEFDNLTGVLTAQITLKYNYFDNNTDFVSKNSANDSEPFEIRITGFKSSKSTIIVPVMNLNNLKPIDDSTNLSSNLIDWSQKNGNNPSNIVNTNFLQQVVYENIESFVQNLYPLSSSNKDDYFNIENPIINYGTSTIEFDLVLNYYFDEKGVPISPSNSSSNSSNNRKTVKIIGFNRNIVTDTTVGILDVSKISQTLTNISVNTLKSNQNIFISAIKNYPDSLSLIFNNLPSTFNDIDYFVNNVSINVIEGQEIDSCTIEFTLNNIFINDNGTVKIGSATLSKNFNGFKSRSGTFVNQIAWDIDPSYLQDYMIAYWDVNDIRRNIISGGTALFTNHPEILEKYIDNLVYNSDGTIKSQISLVAGTSKINAKNGTIAFDIYISPYYDDEGNELDNLSGSTPPTFTIELRNFPKQSSTEVNQSIIYTNQLVTNNLTKDLVVDPIFGSNIVSSVIKWTGSESPDDKLWDKLNLAGSDLINLMLFNTNAASNSGISQVNSQTKITDVDIIESNDFEGSVSFKISIKNYFDESGNWNVNDEYVIDNVYTIYQLNKTQKTNLTKIEASVTELKQYYNESLYGNAVPLNQSIRASEFYKTIINNQNFPRFESFFESLAPTGVYGKGVVNPPMDVIANVQDLKINVFNDVELGGEGAFKNYISYNDADGSVSIKMEYSNVYQKEDINENYRSDNGSTTSLANTMTRITLNNTSPETVQMTLKIVGFDADTSEQDLTTIIAVVGSSAAIIIIIISLSIFLYMKSRHV